MNQLITAPLTIEPVRTWWQRRQFLNLPWQHKNDPNWVPPLRMNQKEMVGYSKHPFYDDAEGQTFLAMRGGTPIGRVMAIVNHAHNRQHAENIGFFGFFECTNDPAAAAGLFDAARAWLKERGITQVRGPANPSLNYECGLLIEGFDTPPTFMMTYNPPYYQELIEGYGFQKVEDMYAFWGHVDMLSGLDKKLRFIRDEAVERFNIKLRRLDRKKFVQDVRMFLDIYNQSLAGTWGFVPLSNAEIIHAADGMKHLIVPEMTSVAEIDGKPVGAVFGMLDFNPIIKKIDGRLFPFGFLQILWGRKSLKAVRVISSNVLPEYQMWGIGLVVVAHLLPSILTWGVQEAEFSWVLESNRLSFGSLKRGGAKITKKYRMYDYVG